MGAQHPLVHAALYLMYVCLAILIQGLQCQVMEDLSMRQGAVLNG